MKRSATKRDWQNYSCLDYRDLKFLPIRYDEIRLEEISGKGSCIFSQIKHESLSCDQNINLESKGEIKEGFSR